MAVKTFTDDDDDGRWLLWFWHKAHWRNFKMGLKWSQ